MIRLVVVSVFLGLLLGSGHAEATDLVANQRVGPPSSHHASGEIGQATESWVERTATWTSPGDIELQAFVDSQAAADRLRP